MRATQRETAEEAEAFRQAKELTSSPEMLVRADAIGVMMELTRTGKSNVRQWAHRFLMERYKGYRAKRFNRETAGAVTPTPDRLQR